ncbi:hypothetical protein O181_013583 [Austropuccinia psidii MF-1]|uniref:Cation efflux protein transmembrane domain-containing protein n=1 Tax=Austropuccinia psidii MF-1 TaxID=1389203 RepID=A0A9Q3BYY9_9BASI|nr:hypothetical protein [Austropuccinia psidii MF-1]
MSIQQTSTTFDHDHDHQHHHHHHQHHHQSDSQRIRGRVKLEVLNEKILNPSKNQTQFNDRNPHLLISNQERHQDQEQVQNQNQNHNQNQEQVQNENYKILKFLIQSISLSFSLNFLKSSNDPNRLRNLNNLFIQSTLILIFKALFNLLNLNQILRSLFFNHHPNHLNNANQSTIKSKKFNAHNHHILKNALWMVLDHTFLIISLTQLSVPRVFILTTFSNLWSYSISNFFYALLFNSLNSVKLISSRQTSSNLFWPGLVGICMLISCFAIDLHLNFSNHSDFLRLAIGYASILVYLIARGNLSSNLHIKSPKNLEIYQSTTLIATGIASLLSLTSFVIFPPHQSYPYLQPPSQHLIPLSALYSFIDYLYTIYPSSVTQLGSWQGESSLTWIVIGALSCQFVGALGFNAPLGTFSDALITLICCLAISNMIQFELLPSTSNRSINQSSGALTLNFMLRMTSYLRKLKSVIETILSNPESRNIYFFLCLNLAYMVVQTTYGIWTNSLGLISDSIHMFFDCMALAVGLFASVMATWPPDQQFTYGYGRVETLSGFANALFLMLISVFIVFEAIQRLIEPPKMNTNQLLMVSSMGLVVNLVGMFATGHHHHHGHSHCHGHGHSHNMKGVFLHVLADTLGSVGVIISTLLIERYGWTGFDPIASIFIAVLIFASVVPLVQDSAKILMLDLGDEKEREVRMALGKLSTIEGLSSYSAPRFWPKDSTMICGSIHLQLDPREHVSTQSSLLLLKQDEEKDQNDWTYEGIEKIKKKVLKILNQEISGLDELIIQIEGFKGFKECFCLTNCLS